MKTDLTIHTEFDNFDDQELVARVQNGDTEAFNPLVYKYQEKIYNLIYRKVRDRETSKDLCQEVFLKAWQALPNFKGQSVFYSWLYQIAVNCSIDFLRKRDRGKVLGFEELPQHADDTLQMTNLQPSPCEVLERKELGHIIRKAIHKLPSGQRSVFYLRHWEDLPLKEIASRLGKSENTVKTYLHQARQKLQNMLRPYLQNETRAWYTET